MSNKLIELAERLESMARGMTYNNGLTEAANKHTIREAAAALREMAKQEPVAWAALPIEPVTWSTIGFSLTPVGGYQPLFASPVPPIDRQTALREINAALVEAEEVGVQAARNRLFALLGGREK